MTNTFEPTLRVTALCTLFATERFPRDTMVEAVTVFEPLRFP
jgi:hypothetical protein